MRLKKNLACGQISLGKNASWGKWGCMKRKIVWGIVKHSCCFSAKTSLKFVSTKNKVHVSFCPVLHTHTTPFSPIGSRQMSLRPRKRQLLEAKIIQAKTFGQISKKQEPIERSNQLFIVFSRSNDLLLKLPF
jgi:hypothetical protein